MVNKFYIVHIIHEGTFKAIKVDCCSNYETQQQTCAYVKQIHDITVYLQDKVAVELTFFVHGC